MTETKVCTRCHQTVDVYWADHPCGGQYIHDVAGHCPQATDPRNPYHTIEIPA